MTISQWQPGTQYDLGSVVYFEGAKYKIIQPHRSQSDWQPPLTPALWGRLPEGYDGDSKSSYSQESGNQPPHYDQKHDDHNPQQQQQQQQQQPHGGDPDHGEKKHWYESKGVKIAGGLLAGAAAVGAVGAGVYAYKHHHDKEEHKEEHKRDIASAAAVSTINVTTAEAWVKEAEERTDYYHKHGPSGPVTWLLVRGNKIPQYAIPGGEEAGEPLYIARFFIGGGLHVGKASSRFDWGALVGYGGREVPESTYEVLVGDNRAIQWVDVSGKINTEKLRARPVEGGREADGTPLFIAQAQHRDSVTPGKASVYMDGASIPYGGGEETIKNYRVLCYH